MALKYTPKEMYAPKVLSMGEDKNADIIRKLARKYRVPVVRNIPLARKLYRECQIDGFILKAVLKTSLTYSGPCLKKRLDAGKGQS